MYTKSIVWLVVLFEVRLYAVQALDVYKVLKGALLLGKCGAVLTIHN